MDRQNMTPYAPAFTSFPAPVGRSVRKPRDSGLSSLLDYGLSLGAQRDLLESAGPLIDIAKIATGTARVYDQSVLRRKLDTYRAHDVKTYMGGQFLEYAFATGGSSAAGRLVDEAAEIGFDIVEVADTCRELSLDVRGELIGVARERLLEVACEVGRLSGGVGAQQLLDEALALLEHDIGHLVIEGAELVGDGGAREDVITLLAGRLELTRVIFELPALSVGGCGTAATEAVKRALVKAIGPDVNLANLGPDEIVETEVVRLGIEDWTAWPT